MPPKKAVPPTEKPDAECESFNDTLTSAGFNEKSIETLGKCDFDSVESLDILATEPNIYQELGLSVQQRLLLKQFVARRAKTGISSNQDSGPGGPTALQHIMAELQNQHGVQETSQVPVPVVQSAASFPGTLGDPQVYLKGGFSDSKHCFRDIVNYINLVPPVADEQVLCADGGMQLVYKSGARQPQLTSVSIEEWALANTRIMNEMLVSGELNHVALTDYMAYTVKICELFKHYDKSSVLNYDREYRHLQSVYKFRWATDTPHLQTTCLRRRQIANHYNDIKQEKADGTSSHTRRNYIPTEVCRLYNTAIGCRFKEKCKYLHKCNEPGCSALHSRAQAHSSSNSVGQTATPNE